MEEEQPRLLGAAGCVVRYLGVQVLRALLQGGPGGSGPEAEV